MLFSFQIEGNIATQPELRYTDRGVAVVNMRVLRNGRYRNQRGEWVEGSTVAVDVTCWRELAERVAELNKGDTVVLELADDLNVQVYGQRASLRATARNVSVSMRWHPASSHRAPRTPEHSTSSASEQTPGTGSGWSGSEDPWAAGPQQQRPVEVPATGGQPTGQSVPAA